MKKSVFLLLSIMLVLGLLVLPAGTARAAVGDDPVVTPVSGDLVFTTEIVPIAQLPGTMVLDSQMLAPVGFPKGEAQFEGAGVRVTGMDYGKATVCFTLSTIAVNQGWGGKVGVWNGTKWVLLPTSITTGTDEAANTTACATISGNGTYAFIKWVSDPTLLPKSLPECSFEIDAWAAYYSGSSEYWVILYIYDSIPDGTPITYRVLSMEPFDAMYGDLSGSSVVWVDIVPFQYAWLDQLMINRVTGVVDSLIQINFPTCQKIISFSAG